MKRLGFFLARTKNAKSHESTASNDREAHHNANKHLAQRRGSRNNDPKLWIIVAGSPENARRASQTRKAKRN